jgi:hypothetical protein
MREKEELREAHRTQERLLPAELPQLPGYDLHAFWQPANEVGGDYFDAIRLSDTAAALYRRRRRKRVARRSSCRTAGECSRLRAKHDESRADVPARTGGAGKHPRGKFTISFMRYWIPHPPRFAIRTPVTSRRY